MNGRRVLLLIPHPDDEVVGCALAIRRENATGTRFFGLYLTTGIPERSRLWPWRRGWYPAYVARRRTEALRAALRLEITPLEFLDWPARSLKDHLSEATERIAAAVAQGGITEIWAPAWEGGHQDHDTANFLAAQFAPTIPVREFAEYNFAGGQLRSGQFISPAGSEDSTLLNEADSRWKRTLLGIYRSERGNLAHIEPTMESLRPLPAHDYGKPAHDGTLFYQRFQWIPFRHPRVDFERPERVCRILTDYRARSRAFPAAPSSSAA